MKEPTYDGGKYCVEHMVEGNWKKKKTGKYLSRNWNHITLGYATHQFITLTRLGNAARLVYEPAHRTVIDNKFLWSSPEHLAWHQVLESLEKVVIPAHEKRYRHES